MVGIKDNNRTKYISDLHNKCYNVAKFKLPLLHVTQLNIMS